MLTNSLQEEEPKERNNPLLFVGKDKRIEYLFEQRNAVSLIEDGY
jgi:hypothetical protein